ncbi:Imm32 family immunity protein [Siphonobacter sp.]|uniref:Imm32 family immunity protein n=1 Tax=Siphonobacter sp. TaxID=1869184 RepID=UPI003B3B0F84
MQKSELKGHLDLIVIDSEDNAEEERTHGLQILIHGDSAGLKSLGQLLLQLAELDQKQESGLPVGARTHLHLLPNVDLSKSSSEVIIGRLDAKGTGEFYARYASKDQ